MVGYDYHGETTLNIGEAYVLARWWPLKNIDDDDDDDDDDDHDDDGDDRLYLNTLILFSKS